MENHKPSCNSCGGIWFCKYLYFRITSGL